MESLRGAGTDSHTDGELPPRWREATAVTAPRGPFRAVVVAAAIVLTIAALAAASSSLLALHGGPVGAGAGRATRLQLPPFHAPVSLATRATESRETFLTQAFKAGGTRLHVADVQIFKEGGQVILIDMSDPSAPLGQATVARLENKESAVVLTAGLDQNFPLYSSVATEQDIPTPAPTPAPEPETITEYDFIGNGWCRPGGCDVREESCRVGGFYRDDSDLDECNSVCNEVEECIGFGISTRTHSLTPSRCYVHTRELTGPLLDLDWTLYNESYHEIDTHSSSRDVSCYRKRVQPVVPVAPVQPVQPASVQPASVQPAETQPPAPAPEPEQPFPWIMCLLWAFCALLAVAACFCCFQAQREKDKKAHQQDGRPASTRTTSLTEVGKRQLRVESIKGFERGQMVVLSSDNGSDACLVSRVAFDHIVLQEGPGKKHPSGASVTVGELRFAEYGGEMLAEGDDLDAVGERMTIETAKEICEGIDGCVGFTYQTDTQRVWFKSAWRPTKKQGWMSFKKDATCHR